MTKDEALALALEALIHKANMIPVMQGNCYVIHPEAMQAVIDEAIKQALAAPTSAEYAMGYAEGFNDGCKPAFVQPVATVQCINGVTIGYLDVMQPVGTKLYTTPPAAQRQWVGLTVQLAREAGIDAWWDSGSDWRETFDEHLKAFEALVRADERKEMQVESEADKVIIEYHEATIKRLEAAILAEREACAMVCDDMGPCGFTGESCAEAIRARGHA